ncbi:MAG: hypothetical protein ACXABL_15475, partial [Candidatus Thorarchaeota archaeon]
WARRLPRSIISFSKKDELMLIAAVPKGGSYGFASAINEISSNSQAGVLSSKTYGSWGFPVELWNNKNQSWRCPVGESENWISQFG